MAVDRKNVYSYTNYQPKESLKEAITSSQELAALIAIAIELEALRPGTILNLALRLALVSSGWRFRSIIRPEDAPDAYKAQDDFLVELDRLTKSLEQDS